MSLSCLGGGGRLATGAATSMNTAVGGAGMVGGIGMVGEGGAWVGPAPAIAMLVWELLHEQKHGMPIATWGEDPSPEDVQATPPPATATDPLEPTWIEQGMAIPHPSGPGADRP